MFRDGVGATLPTDDGPRSEDLVRQRGRVHPRTRAEVDRYLQARGTRLRGYAHLYSKAVIAFALSVASWTTLMFAHPGLWLGLLALAGLTVGTSLVAFCVMHDANHGATSVKRRYNYLPGWTADTLLGLRATPGGSSTTSPTTRTRTWTASTPTSPSCRSRASCRCRSPGPGTGCSTSTSGRSTASWGSAGRRSATSPLSCAARSASSILRLPRGWDLAGSSSARSIFVSWAIVVPLLFYPVVGRRRGLHRLLGADEPRDGGRPSSSPTASRRPIRGGRRSRRREAPWAVHEVETTVNFCPRNPVLTWTLGGLNYQIEHHLFPRVPHTHYPRSRRSSAQR